MFTKSRCEHSRPANPAGLLRPKLIHRFKWVKVKVPVYIRTSGDFLYSGTSSAILKDDSCHIFVVVAMLEILYLRVDLQTIDPHRLVVDVRWISVAFCPFAKRSFEDLRSQAGAWERVDDGARLGLKTRLGLLPLEMQSRKAVDILGWLAAFGVMERRSQVSSSCKVPR